MPLSFNPLQSDLGFIKGTSKDKKNRQSRAFTFDVQRLHRIELKTIQFLNQYFSQIEYKKRRGQNTNDRKDCVPKFQQIRNRFFSLSSQTQQQISQQISEFKTTYKQLYLSQQKKKLQHKLKRVKTSSSTLDQQIKSYEQNVIKKLKDQNLQGNQWVQMNQNTKKKQEWRKKNFTEVQSYKVKSNESFFIRKMTTNYEIEKKRILSNIKKLQLKDKNCKQKSNHLLLDIKEENNQNKTSAYERQNKFVRKAWNLNRGSSEHSKKQNNQFLKLSASQEVRSNDQSLGWGMKLVDLSKFYDQYQTLTKPVSKEIIEKRLKIKKSSDKLKLNQKVLAKSSKAIINQPLIIGESSQNSKIHVKSSQQTTKSHEFKFKLFNDKTNLIQPKNMKKLVL